MHLCAGARPQACPPFAVASQQVIQGHDKTNCLLQQRWCAGSHVRQRSHLLQLTILPGCLWLQVWFDPWAAGLLFSPVQFFQAVSTLQILQHTPQGGTKHHCHPGSTSSSSSCRVYTSIFRKCACSSPPLSHRLSPATCTIHQGNSCAVCRPHVGKP